MNEPKLNITVKELADLLASYADFRSFGIVPPNPDMVEAMLPVAYRMKAADALYGALHCIANELECIEAEGGGFQIGIRLSNMRRRTNEALALADGKEGGRG